ncbi:rRNA maturation RNase YbeY [Nitrosomonas sp. Is37]|uniref:rRNA maturation RNase YbeY n=1 Tax=Nitrosomonas sp. Is37 TaxID=3080535 RepID=UPI00294B9235|nr:rRNA maturation RNase YbeY [Nitrosomonas sp. Is37]MDV6345131.1 rRNA maturation RNase YbeY [Nitrosomonas sp. Is37]
MKNASKVPEPSPATNHKKFKLVLQYATEFPGTPTRSQFRKWVNAALMRNAEIVLRIVDEEEGRELNRHFRGKDKATNVLTFVYDELQLLSGDIVLCAPVVISEAQQQQKDLAAHYAHLTVHGVLHLQGYDHEHETDAAIMEQLETEIVTKLGYADPYHEQ